ncbi:MAG: hypothetical protein WC998_08050, partial [Candidatus Paceibacterota bacterium]
MNCWRFMRKISLALALVLFLSFNASADYQIKSDDVRVDSSLFSGVLSSTDTDVQKALETLDSTPAFSGEPSLGNPTVNGYVLSSTTAGVRSWITPQSGPQGIQGVKGDNGSNGTNGTNGVAATIAVGTVSTGLAG